MSYHPSALSETAREDVITHTQSSDWSAEGKLMSLCYSVHNAEANLIYAVQRGFDTTAYEIRLGQLTAKLSQALEPLVEKDQELIRQRWNYLVVRRTAG